MKLSRPVIYALLALVVLILGLNWPVMATGVKSIPPIWMGALRIGTATALMVGVALARRTLVVPPRRDLPIVASMALFRLTAVTVLVFTALELVPAGRSSVVVWTSSLWTVPIAAIFLGERMTGARWLGLSLGITGVLALFEPWGFDWTEPGVAVGHALLILAAITNASTSVHIRAHRWSIAPLDSMPWQLMAATLILVVLGFAVEGLLGDRLDAATDLGRPLSRCSGQRDRLLGADRDPAQSLRGLDQPHPDGGAGGGRRVLGHHPRRGCHYFPAPRADPGGRRCRPEPAV